MAKKFINKKPKSILDELEQQVVVPKPIDDIIQQQTVQQLKHQTVIKKDKIDLNDVLSEIKNIDDVLDIVEDKDLTEKIETIVESPTDVVKTDIDLKNEDEVVEVVETLKEVTKAIDNVPDIEIEDINDIEITERKKSYIKYKVTVNSSIYSKEISMLAGICKKESGGTIRHRKCDLRLIGNTNNKQLRKSELKLFSESYTIKPVGGIVNKSTRVIISVNKKEPKYIIVYFQNSRDKFIHKFKVENESDFEWLAHWIVEFYDLNNFNASKHKILNKEYGESEIFRIIKWLAKTKLFKIALPKNIGKELTKFSFTALHGDKTHLRFHIYKQSNNTGAYGLIITSDLNRKIYYDGRRKGNDGKPTKNFFAADIMSEKFLDGIQKTLDYHTNEEYTIEEIAYNKLNYRKLKDALVYTVSEAPKEIEFEIVKIMNTAEIVKELVANGKHPKFDYDAENFIFKTKFVDYAIVSYQAIQVTGGDKRHGKDYITRQQYYKRYKVKDRRDYQERKNTVLKRQNNNRNYNARIYMFKITYSIADEKCVFITKNFNKFLEKSKILTTNPKCINN